MYTYSATVIRIVDGDSVWLEVDVGFRMSYRDNFRLVRINAPELRSKDPAIKLAAYQAKDRLEELIPPGTKVTIKTAKSGKYGRWLAEITAVGADGMDYNVNEKLLAEGHAVPYK